jgi:hypothetical protein
LKISVSEETEELVGRRLSRGLSLPLALLEGRSVWADEDDLVVKDFNWEDEEVEREGGLFKG